MPAELHDSLDKWGQASGENATDTAVSQRRRIQRKRLVLCVAALSFSGGLFCAGWLAGRSFNERLPHRVVPGEFERHDAIAVAWTDRVLPGLLAAHQDAVAGIVAAATENMEVVVLVADEQNKSAAAKRFGPARKADSPIRFLQVPSALIWVRDYCPLITKSVVGTFHGIDSIYQQEQFPGQDEIPRAICEALGVPRFQTPIVGQNGNLLSNGTGLCVTSGKLLLDNPHYSESQLTNLLHEYLGATQVLYLEALDGEPTGHVDMFMTFTAADTVVVGQYLPSYDQENAAILDRNAQRLAQIRTASGPLRVHRVPMPKRVGGSWFTYTNVLYANGVLLVPTYGPSNRATELTAMTTYRNLLPGWKITGIDCSRLILGHGALHCVAMNLYKLPRHSSMEVVDRTGPPRRRSNP